MPTVISVSRSAEHAFSKTAVGEIVLIAGEGIADDAHKGKTVKHRSRVKKDAAQLNLRQVHLMHLELIEELQAAGFQVGPGSMGENITTAGLDVLALPTGTVLFIGSEARLAVTGLRNPCAQLDNFQQGLTAAVLGRDDQGRLVRKAGIMSIVLKGGVVRPGDPIVVQYPDAPYQPLVPV